MAVMYNQVLLQWRDKNGRGSVNFMTTLAQDSGGVGVYAPLADAFQACSDAALVAIQFQKTLLVTATPGDGPYCTVFDRAVLGANIAVTGAPTRIEIPGPKAAILKTDNTLVDLSSPLITALNVAATAVLGDQSGHAMGTFKRGIRTSSK